jgi:hypothetical protein
MTYQIMVLSIVGLLHKIPIRMGVLVHKNPHILNGRITSSPLSFVDEFINLIPRFMLCISYNVSMIVFLGPVPWF